MAFLGLEMSCLKWSTSATFLKKTSKTPPHPSQKLQHTPEFSSKISVSYQTWASGRVSLCVLGVTWTSRCWCGSSDTYGNWTSPASSYLWLGELATSTCRKMTWMSSRSIKYITLIVAYLWLTRTSWKRTSLKFSEHLMQNLLKLKISMKHFSLFACLDWNLWIGHY